MLSRKENPTDATDTTGPAENAGTPGDPTTCCITKRAGLVALGMGPLVLGTAVPAAAAEQPPAGPAGPSFNVLGGLGGFVDALPGHWATAGVLAAGGLAAGYLKLKKTPAGAGARVLRGPKGEGFANKMELASLFGERQLLARIPELRPSLHNATGRKPSGLDAGLRLGTDALWKRQLWISCEDSVLIFAPPRSGKSAWLIGAVIDAAGAAVVTSTRADLYQLTHRLRRANGRPVWVFNADVDGVANTIRWNPVKGCEDPNVAMRRAGYMLAAHAKGESMANQSFWDSHSMRLLRALMMAAALKGGTLMDVAAWCSDPNNPEPLRVMEANAHRVPELWYRDLRQEMEAPDKTAAGVYMSLSPTLEFLSLPGTAQIVLPAPGEREFSAEELLQRQGTLYLMGEDREHGSIAPLYSCLVAEIYETAKAMAKRAGGRLDPYGRFILDEAAVICPLPLHRWSADAGGWNIHLVMSVQGRAQLEDRWGRTGADILWQNMNKFALGGSSVPADLETLSSLIGDKDETVVTVSKDRDGKPTESHSLRRVRIMSPSEIRKMKVGTGLYFHRAGSPVLVNYTPGWKRKDVKLALKEEKAEQKAAEKAAKVAARPGIDLTKQQPVAAPAAASEAFPWAAAPPPSAAPLTAVQQPVAANPYNAPPMPNEPPVVPAQQPAAAPASAPAEAEASLPRASGDNLSW
ncbi:type IV secretory system conjugative DNA transfer family protein [Kitasatospora sp. NPDC059648]|uniref:type IV secretory system conjugative DNA transfer family protein n=1 Tax=Kitasatospora sp. NPDC059648 TaxID=3346894 RepID=UPI0036C1074D